MLSGGGGGNRNHEGGNAFKIKYLRIEKNIQLVFDPKKRDFECY